MCEGNFEDNSYRGSAPVTGDDGKEYFCAYDPEECNPLDFAMFGLDRLLPAWVQPQWGKPVLDLGPGRKLIPNAKRIDWPKFDFEPVPQFRLVPSPLNGEMFERRVPNMSTSGLLPYDDNTVGGVFAVNLLEHLWDPRPLIWEVARVLAPGAPFNVFVPDGRSPLYAQDLDHKKPFVLDSFRSLLANPYYAKDHPSHQLELGVSFKFAIKEGNETLIFQLYKKEAA